jgi:hypothetical protein
VLINSIIKLIHTAKDKIMLADKEMFFEIENILREQGVLERIMEK